MSASIVTFPPSVQRQEPEPIAVITLAEKAALLEGVDEPGANVIHALIDDLLEEVAKEYGLGIAQLARQHRAGTRVADVLVRKLQRLIMLRPAAERVIGNLLDDLLAQYDEDPGA